MSIKTNILEGDLALGRDLISGGGIKARGNSHLNGNLNVDGYLKAKNIIGECKGLFLSFDKLKSLYPSPEDGWFAYVGTTIPSEIYVVENGAWKDSGTTGGNSSIDIPELSSSIDALKSFLDKGIIDTETVGIDYTASQMLIRFDCINIDGSKQHINVACNSSTESLAGMMSSEDKKKLNELISNLSTEVSTRENAISSIQTQMNTLLSGNVSTAIDNFNEVIKFLSSVTDDQTLSGLLNNIKQDIDTETSARKAENSTLQKSIDTETSERKADDIKITTSLTAEKNDRENAITTIQKQISSIQSAGYIFGGYNPSWNDCSASLKMTVEATGYKQFYILCYDDSNKIDSMWDTKIDPMYCSPTGNIITVKSGVTIVTQEIDGTLKAIPTGIAYTTDVGDKIKAVTDKIGASGGIAPLDGNKQVPELNLPELVKNIVYVDRWDFNPSYYTGLKVGNRAYYQNVLYVCSVADTDDSSWDKEILYTNKIYIDTENNSIYRWNGSEMVNISQNSNDITLIKTSDGGYILKGSKSTAKNESVALGASTTASGYYSYTEGYGTTASGSNSHAEGSNTIASGYASHASGYGTTASGEDSHSEGDSSSALGKCSHAEGSSTTASGSNSHAEGDHTTASGNCSHAEGYSTASGYTSHAEGYGTTASNKGEHASGYYNLSNKASDTLGDAGNTLFSIGNGQNGNRKNALEIMQDGSLYIAGLGSYTGVLNSTNPKSIQSVINSLSSDVKSADEQILTLISAIGG